MYTEIKNVSTITAILPEAYVQQTLDQLKAAGHSVIRWHARGTLQDKRWYKKFFPSMSPEKGFIRLLVANTMVDKVMQIIIKEGNLHRQGMGAVYSIPCVELYVAGHFKDHSLIEEASKGIYVVEGYLKENLDVIHCIVEKNKTPLIANAVIDAGGHGPIVYYAEGRGLRDRLGWLRITKQSEKEVLTIVVDKSEAELIFDVISHAGELNLPGRGFMYQVPIDKGLFNLPSHYDAHHHEANMQQVVTAIDHLMGDEHWRDQTVFEVGSTGKSAGLGELAPSEEQKILENQINLSVLVERERADELMDIMLDSGAPGLSIIYCQYLTPDSHIVAKDVNLLSEYGIVSCLVSDENAHKIIAAAKVQIEQAGIENTSIFLQPVLKIATYFHNNENNKRAA